MARLKKAFETEKKTALHHIDPDSEVPDAVLAKKCEAFTMDVCKSTHHQLSVNCRRAALNGQ